MSFEYLAGWVWFHELAHTDLQDENTTVAQECTGILAQDGDALWHGGNMDQSPESVRNITMEFEFTRGKNQLVFRGVDW